MHQSRTTKKCMETLNPSRAAPFRLPTVRPRGTEVPATSTTNVSKGQAGTQLPHKRRDAA